MTNKIIYNNEIYKALFFIVFIIKLIVFILIVENYTFASDAEGYHLEALGYYDEINFTNFFGNLLYFLNKYGLYNRSYLTYFIFFISAIPIPLLISYNVQKMIENKRNKIFWLTALIISLYPSLTIFSFDILRDIIMVFIFLIAITFIHISIKSNKISNKALFLIIYIIISIHLYDWRDYLGASMLISIFFYQVLKLNILSFRNLIIIYFILIGFIYSIGLFDGILTYRLGFREGGSTLGIKLVERNLIEFYIMYIYSSFLQMFSLYFINIGSLFVFILESIPFIVSLYYIIKNKIYLSHFHKFLLTFFIIYGTIWLLGNDNLGTAIRLRMFNYLLIFMIAISIYHNKKYITKRGYV